MSKWRDASEIGMIHDLPDKKLRELDKEMRQKPNFSKTNNVTQKKTKKKR